MESAKLDYFKDFIVLATAIIYNQRGEILFLKRSQNNKTFRGFWQLPEGKMDFGEQAEETLTRELREELGIKLKETKILVTNSTVISVLKKKFHLFRIVFRTEVSGRIILSKEHSAFKWLSLKIALRLPYLFPGTEEALKILGKDLPLEKM